MERDIIAKSLYVCVARYVKERLYYIDRIIEKEIPVSDSSE